MPWAPKGRHPEDAEQLTAIRARIRRSIDDPRPSLTEAKADVHFKTLYVNAANLSRKARA
jgi:antitoxin ParD1/3/4